MNEVTERYRTAPIPFPATRRQEFWWVIKGFMGWSSIKDGSTCWYSKFHGDDHDYRKSKGGDGTPTHFYKYHCSRCGKEFEI